MPEFILQGPALLAAVLCVLAAAWFAFKQKRSPTLPPGPPTKPIIGNLGQLLGRTGKDRYRSLARAVNQYGKNGMATIYFGSRPLIFITNLDTIKIVLHSNEMLGKPLTVRDEFFHRKGLILTDGDDAWKEQRRFALSTLRDFGMGKTWLQDLIIEEAQELVEDFKNADGKPFDPVQCLTPSVCNVIAAISYGQRFSHKDEKFSRLALLISENQEIQSKNLAVEFFPFLRYVPFSAFRARHLAWWKNIGDLTAFFGKLMEEHHESLREGEPPRDYLHAFMVEAAKQKDNSNTTFTDDQLLRSVLNLFSAGTETTATTLAWAILYMLDYPAVFDRVQKEIDSVVGNGRYATLEVKDRLPYTQATIMEVQRLANLVSIVARRTLTDVTLDGFKIPAGIGIAALSSAVHEDARFFPDPLAFKPERFLDQSGKLRSKVEGFIPFSIGKRFCIGESLAKMELYIFFTSLVKNFQFRIPSGETVDSNDAVWSAISSPKPFKAIFEAR
ncbi:Cytochrome P450 2J3 [Hypsibius exemplaris]|uniref:Cytochrome P450 2J3 n=1 Tax=Hypsibius exemplaris TaxID=2072580 RepID=A0A9X6NKY4_HYPEX|nr:Cytochrome P450 2J3 [Hypsibius exemplaris]